MPKAVLKRGGFRSLGGMALLAGAKVEGIYRGRGVSVCQCSRHGGMDVAQAWLALEYPSVIRLVIHLLVPQLDISSHC